MEKKSSTKISKAKLLLNFLRDNESQAFYARQIFDRLKDHGFKPSDVMTNVRLFEKKNLVYVRGYRTETGQTPFREGYLITWINHNKPREKALEEAIEVTNKVLTDRHTKNPLIERVQKIRDQIIEATKLKDLASFDFLLNKLACSQCEAENSVGRAMQLYSDLREIKIFGNFRYYYHASFNEEELKAAISMKENYIRKTKGRANRIGHNWEAAIEFFIDSLTTGAKFWSQNHQGKRMDPRRITVHLMKEVAGKTRAGGQSARRYERLRDAQLNEYYTRVGKHANEVFLPIENLKGIILGGPGPTKFDFQKGGYLHYQLQNKIIEVIDSAYVEEQGVKEAVEKAPEIMKKVRYIEEKEIMQKFLYEVGHDTGMITYGEAEVRRALETGAVRMLLLSESLDLSRVTIQCGACGYEEKHTIKNLEKAAFEQGLVGKPCPKCQAPSLAIADKQDIVDDLAQIAEYSNTDVEVISTETEEGQMLKNAFGGIAAILRYKTHG